MNHYDKTDEWLDFGKFFDGLPEWVKLEYSQDNWLYHVLDLVKHGRIKKEEFFEKLAKFMMERARSAERSMIDHFKICMSPILLRRPGPDEK